MKKLFFTSKTLVTGVLLIGLFFGCKKNTSETEVIQENETVTQISEKPLAKLSPESEVAAATWKFFKEFENDLKQLSHQKINSQSAIVERMVFTSDSLTANVPEILKNNIILSRTRVLNTRTKLLNQSLKQANSDATTKNLEEILYAYNNLINQMNVRFEKMRIDELTQTEANVKNLIPVKDSIPADN